MTIALVLVSCGENGGSRPAGEGKETPSLTEAAAALAEEFEADYVAAGATSEEAACIGDAILTPSGPPRELPPRVAARLDDLGTAAPLAKDLLERGGECASPRRLLELADAVASAPLRGHLVAAGASAQEAECLTRRVPNLAVFLEDAEPTLEAAAMEQFLRDGRDCAPRERLRRIWAGAVEK